MATNRQKMHQYRIDKTNLYNVVSDKIESKCVIRINSGFMCIIERLNKRKLYLYYNTLKKIGYTKIEIIDDAIIEKVNGYDDILKKHNIDYTKFKIIIFKK